MNRYITVGAIKAKPMRRDVFAEIYEYDKGCSDLSEGYLVKDINECSKWVSKEVFEKDYMMVGSNNTITQENVDGFIKEIDTTQLGDKTTVVKVTLVNDFIIVDSSSCVDPKNFDMKIGEDICIKRIKNKIWELLGFVLQTVNKGVK